MVSESFQGVSEGFRVVSEPIEGASQDFQDFQGVPRGNSDVLGISGTFLRVSVGF